MRRLLLIAVLLATLAAVVVVVLRDTPPQHLPWKPLVAYPITAGWLRAIRAGHRRVRQGLALAVPILVLHSDRTVRTRG